MGVLGQQGQIALERAGDLVPIRVDDDVRAWQRVNQVIEPIVHVPSAATVDHHLQPAGNGIAGRPEARE